MILFRKLAETFGLALLLIALTAQANAATWIVNTSKSKLGFSGTQTGTQFKGTFSRFAAEIAFDPDRLDVSHLKVTVELASASTGDQQRDIALPGKDWFDVSHFPQAQFESNAIRKTGDSAYEAAGTLTIRGVSQNVALPFDLVIDGSSANAKGHLTLVRTGFGIGQGPWSTGQWVALEVNVFVDIAATKAN
jgi:polyisoprenoid-binding protein YceI